MVTEFTIIGHTTRNEPVYGWALQLVPRHLAACNERIAYYLRLYKRFPKVPREHYRQEFGDNLRHRASLRRQLAVVNRVKADFSVSVKVNPPGTGATVALAYCT